MAALITGASRGIGKAIALEMLKRTDMRIALVSRTPNIRDVAEEMNSIGYGKERCCAFQCDVEKDDLEKLVQGIHNTLGPIISLVNNAGDP